MGLFDFFNKKAVNKNSVPRQMILRFMSNGQVAWFSDDTQSMIDNGFLGNHAIYTIQDWKSGKVASCPPIVYEVKNEKAYKLYRSMLKNATRESLMRAKDLQYKALDEVEGTDMQKVLDRPNNMMTWFEFIYGHTTFKDMCGSSYIGGTRDGILDPTQGAIRSMDLLPSQDVVIVSGTQNDPIKEYFLKTNPDTKIDVRNVLQTRNFSPRYETQSQWMYGLSRLYPLRSILQEYNEAVSSNVKLYQDGGVRDIIFKSNHPQELSDDLTPEQSQAVEDVFNRKIKESGNGGLVFANSEVGSIRVGFSPVEMGILESKKILKTDFCAAYHIPDIIFGWSDQTTYNNLSESRKIAVTDAILPELEQLTDGLNNWLVPSYDNVKQPLNNQKQKLVIGFDHEYFAELQEDKNEMIKWLKESPVTPNEWRRAMHYDDSPEENANKIMVPSTSKLLEDLGMDSFGAGDASIFGQDNNDK